MASQHGSRKRQKVSLTQTRDIPVDSATATLGASKQATDASNVDKMATTASTTVSNSGHADVLKTLHNDVESMRQLVTCKICDRLMYEPYSLACGHAYCYSCLSQWLVGNHKKTCPDCRSPISQTPIPSYIVRELVLIFVSRTELLPEGETSEEHEKWAKEEREIVAKDKANTDRKTGGLFKGCFKQTERMNRMLFDPGDAVSRCPICLWEIEDPAYCLHCGESFDVGDGLGFSDYDDSDISDDELDNEIDLMDAEAVFGNADGQADLWDPHDEDDDSTQFAHFGEDPRTVLTHRGTTRTDGESVSSDSFHDTAERLPGAGERRQYDEDEEDEGDEYDSELNDFIVDDEAVEGGEESDEGSEATEVQATYNARPANDPNTRRRARVVISDDEDEDNDDDDHDDLQPQNNHHMSSDFPHAVSEHVSSALRAGRQALADAHRATRHNPANEQVSSALRAGEQASADAYRATRHIQPINNTYNTYGYRSGNYSSDGASSGDSGPDSDGGGIDTVSSTLQSDGISTDRRDSSDLESTDHPDSSDGESMDPHESFDEESMGPAESLDDASEDLRSEGGADHFDHSD